MDQTNIATIEQPNQSRPRAVFENYNETDQAQRVSMFMQLKSLIRIPQHIVDGIIFVFVTVLIVLLNVGYIPAVKVGFVCNDPLISHRYNGDTVTPVMLGLSVVFLPLLTILFTEILRTGSYSRINPWDAFFLYKECTVGCALVLLVTEIIKVLVGEHRPHFLDVCEPDTNKYCANGTFVEHFRCTTTRFSGEFVVDSSLSFPSGHSSISVFVGLFSAYILQTRMPTDRTGELLKPLLISVCLTFSLVCSLSRITDRRHHWWDVLAGVVLGAFGAFFRLTLVHLRMYGKEGRHWMTSSSTTLLDIKDLEV